MGDGMRRVLPGVDDGVDVDEDDEADELELLEVSAVDEAARVDVEGAALRHQREKSFLRRPPATRQGARMHMNTRYERAPGAQTRSAGLRSAPVWLKALETLLRFVVPPDARVMEMIGVFGRRFLPP